MHMHKPGGSPWWIGMHLVKIWHSLVHYYNLFKDVFMCLIVILNNQATYQFEFFVKIQQNGYWTISNNKVVWKNTCHMHACLCGTKDAVQLRGCQDMVNIVNTHACLFKTVKEQAQMFKVLNKLLEMIANSASERLQKWSLSVRRL